MCSLSLWLISTAALLVADVRTGTLLQKESVSRHRCYKFIRQENRNETAEDCQGCLADVQCPAEQTMCATVAVSPSFTSLLQCAEATETEEGCMLLYSPTDKIHRITCVCANELCNHPFTNQLIRELEEFTSNAAVYNTTNTTDVTDLFVNSSLLYRNAARNELFSLFIKDLKSNLTLLVPSNRTTTLERVDVLHSESNVTGIEVKVKDVPRAEALKHEVTDPSDDDEDDGEGSGAWREEKHPASVPAAPSSFLPANENKAASLFINLLPTLMSSLLLYIINCE